MKTRSLIAAKLAVLGMMVLGSQAQAATLNEVLDAGELECGVSDDRPGFSQKDRNGRWAGLNVDTCRAFAAALFDDADAVNFTPLTEAEAFTALQTGEIDVLTGSSAWAATRDSALELNFTGINFHDGQGFMVKAALGAERADQLDNTAICMQSGSTAELNIAHYFRENDMRYEAVMTDSFEASAEGFQNDQCDVLSADISKLAALRPQLDNPDDTEILPDRISKKPLGPVVRQGDDEWFNIIKWVLYGQINAEEHGIDSENIEAMRDSSNPAIQGLIGRDARTGELLGLEDNFMVDVISQVGHYGEMFDRNVGPDTPLGLERGINALWTEGGILYAPPFR